MPCNTKSTMKSPCARLSELLLTRYRTDEGNGADNALSEPVISAVRTRTALKTYDATAVVDRTLRVYCTNSMATRTESGRLET